MLTLRYGSRRIVLKRAKPAIEIGDEAQLLPTLKLVREAVAAGELDKLLMTAKEQRGCDCSRGWHHGLRRPGVGRIRVEMVVEAPIAAIVIA